MSSLSHIPICVYIRECRDKAEEEKGLESVFPIQINFQRFALSQSTRYLEYTNIRKKKIRLALTGVEF